MIVDVPTDKIVPCQCGHKPLTYSIAYGRTPYGIWCPTCRKGLSGGHNDPQEMFDLWERLVAPRINTDISYRIRYQVKDRDWGDGYRWLKKPQVVETRCMGLYDEGKPLRAPRKDQKQHPKKREPDIVLVRV